MKIEIDKPENMFLEDIVSNVKGITLKSDAELHQMRLAARVVSAVIELLLESIRPGIKAKDLDGIADSEIKRLGAKPSFKGYRGFPATICVSFNEEIVHGIPGERIVSDGDVLSLDVGAIVGGYHSDSAVTVAVGEVGSEVLDLIEATRLSLEEGISKVVPGNRIGDVSSAIQNFAESRGYGVVREYVGHGIGRALHEEPSVPNFGDPGKGLLLRPGMVIAVEPMLNMGSWRTRVLKDDWTVVTEDGGLSAHFEHTIAITEKGAEVLTRRTHEIVS